MAKVTYSEVKEECIKGRYFAYDSLTDRIFVPPSKILVWLFVRLGWSGNAVSVLSGVIALVGGVMMASSNVSTVIIGSFGYAIYKILDYVDGAVARFNNVAGIGGQYMDWIMHVVSGVGIMTGIFIGAHNASGDWIIPFGVLTVVASALALDRFSFAWFAICMHHQQQRVKGKEKEPFIEGTIKKTPLMQRIFRRLTAYIFYENYSLALFPILAVTNIFMIPYYDFRVLIIVLGGVVYFPVLMYDIWLIATTGRVDDAYRKLFFSKEIPKLPDDHFLGY